MGIRRPLFTGNYALKRPRQQPERAIAGLAVHPQNKKCAEKRNCPRDQQLTYFLQRVSRRAHNDDS